MGTAEFMGIHTIGYSLVPLGGLFLGALADSYGASQAIIVGGCVYLAAIAVTSLAQRNLREIDGSTLQSGQAEADDQVGLAAR